MRKRLLVHILVTAASGGCERACDHLCLYGAEVEHWILVLGGEGEMSKVWTSSGATVEHLQMLGKSRFVLSKALRERLRMLMPDAVIIWHGMAELPVILNSIPADCPSVAVHGGNPASNLSRWTDLKYLMMEWLLFPRGCKPLYICCSQHVSKTFENSHYLNRFARCVVPNGVYQVPDEMVHVARPLPVEGRPIVMGMLARLDLIKDQATPIRAMAAVKKVFPNVILELAGDGDQLDRLRHLASELELSDNVRFLGSVKDVTNVIRHWDICLYATTVNEGFGIALAEGLMVGLPTIVTDVGPTREVCSADGCDAAIYVNEMDPEAMAKAALRLICDFQSRRELAVAARAHALRHLSGQTFARRYLTHLLTGH